MKTNKKIVISVNEKDHKKLKDYCYSQRKTIQTVCLSAINKATRLGLATPYKYAR
jgi:hypothetical protein